jgi:cytoskeletal protein CcmA (bactofilin family)
LGQEIFALSLPQTIRKGEKQLDLFGEFSMLEVKRKPALPSHGSASARAFDADPRTRPPQREEPSEFRGKLPVITGECRFKGQMSIDGLLTGQVGSQSGVRLTQKPSKAFVVDAELTGEFDFKGMVRVNGHIAGSVYSKTGTLIVDAEARVDATIDVAVAVIGGTVAGDIVARERVELGPSSRIYGNIWTRAIVIKDGAIFEGVCHMIDDRKQAV